MLFSTLSLFDIQSGNTGSFSMLGFFDVEFRNGSSPETLSPVDVQSSCVQSGNVPSVNH
jgi:hypothetical protein